MANPNPSPSTRFGAENGNPIAGGKTKKQKEAEYRAAENAAILRDRMLSFIVENTESDEKALMELLDANILKLFKDSEDRAHGTPKQSVDHSSEDGSMTPRPTSFVVNGVEPDNGEPDT
jgi:hypothetical protein